MQFLYEEELTKLALENVIIYNALMMKEEKGISWEETLMSIIHALIQQSDSLQKAIVHLVQANPRKM